MSHSGGGLRAVVVAVVAGLALQPSAGRADDGQKLLQQVQQLGGDGSGADIMAQLEAELGGLLGGKPTGYAYTNDLGHRVEAATLEEIPAQYRQGAQPVHAGAKPAAPARPPGPSEMYKYKNHEGREVYTNIVEQIPVEEREAALLDLSHITLNSQLGTEIHHRLTAAHSKLIDSDYCQDIRDNAKSRAFKDIWDEYAPLIICGILLLLFVLGSPFMVRSVGGPAWSRTLMFALPALAFGGFIMYSMTSTNRAIVRFKQAQSQEESCEEGALDGAVAGSGTGALGRQLDLIKNMQKNMHSHLQGIADMDDNRNNAAP